MRKILLGKLLIRDGYIPPNYMTCLEVREGEISGFVNIWTNDDRVVYCSSSHFPSKEWALLRARQILEIRLSTYNPFINRQRCEWVTIDESCCKNLIRSIEETRRKAKL